MVPPQRRPCRRPGRRRADAPRGQREIDRAKEDGRWDRAYAGSATAEIPEDLAAALAAEPALQAAFERLNRQERFSVLGPLLTAATDATRARRLAKAIAELREGA